MPPIEPSVRTNNTQDNTGIVDPAVEHFQRSAAAYELYDNLVLNDETSVEYLAEPSYELVGRSTGNQASRQGFDSDSFRFRG